jgi:hypothetical protein
VWVCGAATRTCRHRLRGIGPLARPEVVALIPDLWDQRNG